MKTIKKGGNSFQGNSLGAKRGKLGLGNRGGGRQGEEIEKVGRENDHDCSYFFLVKLHYIAFLTKYNPCPTCN